MRLILLSVVMLLAVNCAAMGYLDAMELAVKAYSADRLSNYVNEADCNGIAEHGFPRLTSNLSILVAHGRMPKHKDLAQRMLDICFRDVVRVNPPKKVGNDFSIKELVFALQELEAHKTFSASIIDQWKARLATVRAEDVYSVQPKLGDTKRAYNWCVFGAASEQLRIAMGVGGSPEYVERYVSDQLRWFDGNGMYKDPHCPMVYDLVTRLQFATILHYGYNGPSRAKLEELLDKSADITLLLQSVSGEIPYGGRSNQFLHNETFYAALCEWYATRAKQRGDMKSARKFRGAAKRAMDSLAYWAAVDPIRHIKNYYPIESGYGCESYAYFDKYMVTMGSWAYCGLKFADESIEPDMSPIEGEFKTSPEFHREIISRGGYTVELDWDAQMGYDANGIGRIHKLGAPTAICLSVPCPQSSHYKLDITNEISFAIASTDGKLVRPSCIDERGVLLEPGKYGLRDLMLPAFCFDGESNTEIKVAAQMLEIAYRGWKCQYHTNGKLIDTGKIYANRNGHYRRFDAVGDDLVVRICITK